MATPRVDGLSEKQFTRDVVDRLAAHWADILREYRTQLSEGATPPPKAIKDSVWGMIDLTGSEVILLDSPPLQRLRRIHQLGLCFLTFPTATHTRFEHTLGVIYQAERMVRALAVRSEGHAQLVLSALKTIRLAALLYDVGHLPLSHVSERFYSDEECTDAKLLATVTHFRNEVRKHFQSPKVSLAECLSAAFVLLPEFRAII